MTTLTWDRHRGHASSYDVVRFGFNYRLDEIRAAMGLVQLRRVAAENAGRARISARYREALDGVGGLTMPFGDPDAQQASSHHLAVVAPARGHASASRPRRAHRAAHPDERPLSADPRLHCLRDARQRPLPARRLPRRI